MGPHLTLDWFAKYSGHIFMIIMIKARENTVEFKRGFCIWCPHGKMKSRRPIYPANVPKQVRNNYFPWYLMDFPTSPWKKKSMFRPSEPFSEIPPWQVCLFIYFHFKSFTFPDSLLRFASCIMNGDTSCYFISRYLPAAGAAWRSFPLFGLQASFIFLCFLLWAEAGRLHY